MASASNFENVRMAQGSSRDYTRAHKTVGWFQCMEHMERLTKPSGYWTIERCMEDAKRFQTIVTWQRESKSAYSIAQRNGWLDQCVGHMAERWSGQTRGHAVYIWEWVEDGKGTGILQGRCHQPGVLGDGASSMCTSRNGIDYRLIAICQTSEQDAVF